MISAAEIKSNVSPHYANSRDFLIAAVLGSPFCHSTRFQRMTKKFWKTNFTNETYVSKLDIIRLTTRIIISVLLKA